MRDMELQVLEIAESGPELVAWRSIAVIYAFLYIHDMQSIHRKRAIDIASLAFVAVVAIGGYFIPYLGLALAILMAAAVGLSVFGPRKRMFCSAVCPRGRALGFVMKPFSRGRSLPAWMLRTGTRRALCGFMMLCVGGNLFRNTAGLQGAGGIFWTLCLVSLSGGIALGALYKPRAWCAVCPMGTLQDTVRRS